MRESWQVALLPFRMRVAAAAGTVLYLLMWTAELPLVTNPILDDHLTGAVSLIVLALTFAGTTWGLGRVVGSHSFVQKNPC